MGLPGARAQSRPQPPGRQPRAGDVTGSADTEPGTGDVTGDAGSEPGAGDVTCDADTESGADTVTCDAGTEPGAGDVTSDAGTEPGAGDVTVVELQANIRVTCLASLGPGKEEVTPSRLHKTTVIDTRPACSR